MSFVTSWLMQLSGSRRLQDAIVLGYQLHRVSGKDIDVPEWYKLAQDEFSFHTPSVDETNILDTSIQEYILCLGL